MQRRQPKGTTTGGQFTPGEHPDEPPVGDLRLTMPDGGTPEEAFQELRCLAGMHLPTEMRLTGEHGEWVDTPLRARGIYHAAPPRAISKSFTGDRLATRCRHCGEWKIARTSISAPEMWIPGAGNQAESWKEHRRQSPDS